MLNFISAFRELISDENAYSDLKFDRDQCFINDLIMAEFPTSQAYFSSIKSIQQQSKEKGIISIDFLVSNVESQVEEGIRNAFQQVKNEKVYGSLRTLFKDLQLPYAQIPGKGDHLKVYIGDNGQPIVIPVAHTYLKPGTMKSIQNQMLATVKEEIEKKEKLLNS